MSTPLRRRLARRAGLAARIRAFFAERDVLEVGTELTVAGVTDVHLDSVALADGGYLRTSPEYAHKRLLAAGAGDLYELGPVVRAGEHGRHHRREFWMLEWYRTGFDARRLADEVIALIRHAGPDRDWTVVQTHWTDEARAVLGFDPHRADVERIAEALPEAPDGLDRSGLYDWLLAMRIQPRLAPGRLTVIQRFPACQAALARLSPDDPRTAERFEVFAGPLELANGYHELTDPAEQRRRFEADNATRRSLGRPEMPVDDALLAALDAGLPDCAGVALGFERLLMAVHGLDDIADAEGLTGAVDR
ncbi:EF-P lysine aminoacylase GenX [Wenzhouxiangella sp. XN79A]|uniref:EF-P lysine aminoacylase EpmA n=1 Tax=Wenzhouxiangella sp. XN79A TaxID=2724193 RepID=UPI00144AC129|nr:EF-P lysine aminoacylase EpmA [Wenzhouxiangella sp. XN79A]NKI35927.1 EF-P lysine aminoacylase GenX [Wenzhouxiangella sp. XN79A]